MAISYNVYSNNGQGGDVNYASPIATTTATTLAVGSLAASSDYTFALRAFDAISGIEEANTDARVRIVIDASGNDVSAQPNPVIGLSTRPTAGGTCWVSWGYQAAGQRGVPSQFNVFLTLGPTPSLASPAAMVAYLPGVDGYGYTLSGLAGGTSYTIAVQAVGPSAALTGPVATVAIHYHAPLLSNIDSLMAVPSA